MDAPIVLYISNPILLDPFQNTPDSLLKNLNSTSNFLSLY